MDEIPAGESGLTQNSLLVALGVVAVSGVTGSAISPTNAATILGFCTLICVSLLSMLQRVAQDKKVNKQVTEVKDALVKSDMQNAEKLNDIAATGQATHTLVNSNMGTQLKISSVALHRVAELTKHPDDVAAADLAEKLLHEHQGKQDVVDAKAAKAAPPVKPVQ